VEENLRRFFVIVCVTYIVIVCVTYIVIVCVTYIVIVCVTYIVVGGALTGIAPSCMCVCKKTECLDFQRHMGGIFCVRCFEVYFLLILVESLTPSLCKPCFHIFS
jgi:hypothetical protein